MKRNSALSSEQALNDYFYALLDESIDGPVEELELVQEIEEQPVTEFSKPAEVVPQLQKNEEISITEPVVDEAGVPNLDDIQRLLDRLETADPVADLGDVEALIEQNTLNLTVTEPVVTEETEIQEWDVETVEEAQLDDVVSNEVLEVTQAVTEPTVDIQSQIVQETAAASVEAEWTSTERSVAFQVLYFDVYGILFAVPLDELGGIHRLESTNHLIGRPEWYLGLQTNRDSQLDVVDTAKWVMADKLSGEEHKESYQYIVMLGESLWGLACGELKGTELVRPEQVRWREVPGKRPWLAGMVKEKMCALIHVEALIEMLQSGLDVKALNN